ncbi:oxidized low-density lipoprotein receptor 1-like [Hemitrygon akajei]|uniref:oxidized low-density lipoprotein receptor 1-like n=1 Tax=Hemitrygon akajei TaxID=2704970 RepID=UPI003BF9B2DA
MGNERPASRDRSDQSIWLICVLTVTLIITGICWRIHVSQICPSLKRTNSDLRHQFTEMETKYRSVNETKDQICELLTSRREQAFSQDWIRNEDPCYFISAFNRSYDEAKQYCSNSDSKLLEINSAEEENFVAKAVRDEGISYWIGKCKDGKVASNVLFRMNGGDPECAVCTYYTDLKPCDQVRTRFICEKSAPLCPVISQKIQDLCQQPVEPT